MICLNSEALLWFLLVYDYYKSLKNNALCVHTGNKADRGLVLAFGF